MAVKILTGVDNSNQRLVNLADPAAGTDAATKQYVDNKVVGLQWKANVKAASTANVAVATGLVAGAVVDGVTLAAGDRVLLRAQTTASENGVYIVAASGAASRAADANTSALVEGMAVRVAQGTTLGDTMWQMVTDSITLGTTGLVYTQFSAGQSYTGGNGITVSGTTIAVNPAAGGGILVAAGGVSVDSSVVARKAAGAIGDGTSTVLTFAHNLNSLDVDYQVWDVSVSPRQAVAIDPSGGTVNTLVFTFPTAPATGQYRVVAQG